MEVVVIEKQALDELTFRLETLKSKLDRLYVNSGVCRKEKLDNQQVCMLLSISKRTLQNLRDSGVLPFTKSGGKIFYLPEDIDRVMFINYKKERQ